MLRPPIEIGVPDFKPETASQRYLRHVQRASHEGVVDLSLPKRLLSRRQGKARITIQAIRLPCERATTVS